MSSFLSYLYTIITKAITGKNSDQPRRYEASFWATVCKTVRPMLSDRCLSCLSDSLSVLSVMLVYCGKTVGWINMKLGVQVGLDPGHFVLDGEPVPPPQRGTASPKFLAHFYCGQTAGCIKMPLGMEVGLGPGHIVLGGYPAPPKRGHSPLIFGPCLLMWPNGWMHQDTTWYGGRHRPR